MGYIEVDKNGRMHAVRSSKKKTDKGGKSRKDTQEPIFYIDEEREHELLSEINHLKTALSQVKDENKNLRQTAVKSEQVAKAWKAEALELKDKYENAAAGRDILVDRVTRRDDEIQKKSRDIKELVDDKKKLKSRADDLLLETSKRGDAITILKDQVRRLKEDSVRSAVKEEKLQDEIKVLTRLVATGRNPPRRREEPPRRQPYDYEHWDGIGPLPFRDNLRPRWGGRDYESDN